MNLITRAAYYYVLGILCAIDGYAKWCEGKASTEAQLGWMAFTPVAVFALILFSLPETIRQLIGGCILVPPIYLAIITVINTFRVR